MHRCLRIQEVLSNIFAYIPQAREVGPDTTVWYSAIKSPTLAALARTCRTFHEVALASLWSTVTPKNLDVLLGCLPETCWFYDEYRHVVLKDEIESESWARFDFYARFVRELVVELYFGVRIEEDQAMERTLYALSRTHPQANRAVFPHLSTVRCSITSAVATLGLLALLGPDVESIQIYCEFPGSSFVKSEALELPADLRGVDVMGRYHSRLSRSLSGLHARIRVLHLEGVVVTADEVSMIATMPRLLDLGIHCMARSSLDRTHDPSGSLSSFPRLRSITFRGDDGLAPCTSFLTTFHPASLTVITVRSCVLPESPDELPRFFSALSEIGLSTTLETLRCEISLFKFDWDPANITFRDLEPLLALTRLRSLSLEFTDTFENLPYFFDSRDDDFALVAQSWPQLRTFTLDTGPLPWEDCPNRPPTVQALVHLARHPALSEIGLTFRLPPQLPGADSLSLRLSGSSSVRVLDVVHSALGIRDAPMVARYLSQVFPNIEELKTRKDSKKWDDVRARLQCRERAQGLGQ